MFLAMQDLDFSQIYQFCPNRNNFTQQNLCSAASMALTEPMMMMIFDSLLFLISR